MNDSLEEFETELSRLRPRAISADLSDRIAEQLDMPIRANFSDRCLMTFMGAGALAAVLIVGLIGLQVMENDSPTIPPASSLATAHAPASMGDYQQAFARSDGPALEIFR